MLVKVYNLADNQDKFVKLFDFDFSEINYGEKSNSKN